MTIVRELVAARPDLGLPPGLDRMGGLLLTPAGLSAEPARTDVPLSRTGLYRSVVDLLAGALGGGPIAVLIDDLHGVDNDTLTLLSLVVDELVPRGLLFAVALRPDEPGAAAARSTIGRIRRDLVSRNALRPLTAKEVARLADQLSGAVVAPEVGSAIHDRSAGNPLFATELIRLLTSERRLDPEGVYAALPSEVLEVLQQRLDRLPETTLALLSVIALAGGPADVDLLAEVTGVDPEAVLDGCESALLAGLLLDDVAGGFTLSHDLVRQTLDRGLSAARRIRLHAKIGTVLRQRESGTPRQIVNVARHLSLAAPVLGPAAAVPYLIAASEDAISRFAHEQSEQDLLRALELARAVADPAERTTLEGQVRGRLVLLRAWSVGRVSLESRPVGGAFPRPLPMDSEQAASWLGTVVMTSIAGDYVWATEAANDALAHDLPPAGQVAAHFARGWSLYCLGLIDDAGEEFQAVEAVLATGELAVVAGLYSSTVPTFSAAYSALIAQVRGDSGAADEWLSLVAQRCRTSGTPGTDAELAYCWVGAMRGDAEMVLEHARTCIEIADRHEYTLIRLQAEIMGGWARVMLSQPDGLPIATGAYATYVGLGMRNQTPFFLWLLAEADAALGDRASAAERVREAAGVTAETGEVCRSPRLLVLTQSLLAGA